VRLLIANSRFQSGAIDLAASEKIGLGRIKNENKIDWITYRKDKEYKIYNRAESESPLTDNILQEKDFFAFNESRGFDRFSDLLINLKIIDFFVSNVKYIKLPYRTNVEIETTVIGLSDESLYVGNSLNDKYICSMLEDNYNVEFNFKELLKDGILGKICFNPLRIYVTQALRDDIHRWRFTLAHEIGHLILHRELLCQYIDEYIDSGDTLSLSQSDKIAYNKRLEIQANIFAGSLLIPKKPLLGYVNEYFKKENIHRGRLFLDDQIVNQKLVFVFLSELSIHFNVSKEVAKYRLIGLGLLKDKTDISLKGIIRDMKLPHRRKANNR
jgi:Zn-dependent peptidase ImmA (M78 family)